MFGGADKRRCMTFAVHQWIEKIGGAVGAGFLLAALISGMKDNLHLFDLGAFWKFWVCPYAPPSPFSLKVST